MTSSILYEFTESSNSTAPHNTGLLVVTKSYLGSYQLSVMELVTKSDLLFLQKKTHH